MTDEASRLVEAIPELDGVTGMKAVASGGFSRIYQAYQPALNRTVAIKIVESSGIDPRTRERFAREMGMTGMLGEHPHIVDVYHSGLTRSGEPFLMMRWYEGGSLADGLRESGPMPTAVLLPFAVKVTSALAYVHRHQMLHRDIKPGNILLTALNEPVLADFGIAVDARQAGTATAVWTPVHAAPEVMAYEEPTPSSDIWSLGSTLYAALAGRPPFPVDPGNTLASIQQRFRAAPPPFVRTDVPSSLTDLLAQALATKPDDRPDAVGIVTRLQEIERECGLPVTSAPGVITAPGRSGPARPQPPRPVPPESPSTGGPSFTPKLADSSRSSEPSASLPFGAVLLGGADPRALQEEATLVPQRSAAASGGVLSLPSEVTGTPDAPTVLGADVIRDKPQGWSWKRRLVTAALGGLSTLVLVLVALSVMAPDRSNPDETPEVTASFAPPVVSGLRRTDRSPTSITIAWHTQGAYVYPHRVVFEGGQPVWLKDDENKAEIAVLTGLEPGTRYCIRLDAVYTLPQTPAPQASSTAGPKIASSSSERKCFWTAQ
ncbi:protein kinase [Kineosporia sp. NBRC 101731]|uniref:protein kinase domain-containing protein n=1 Tax=Kineosporia sp. NBRC 101731 TaxID=3032199 RepID=UPI0024A47439|nr:protein kinase [Kineosporia sp. NBRC 101731]GLY29096.1 hypothetical protein Kisp02_24610 [Kineosporia sp. NBRC 101731]